MGMKYINFIATYSCTDYRGNLKKDAAEAKDELIRMNSNREERLLYEMRSKILQDNISVLNEAECKGEQNKAFEIARILLKSLDNETICKMTGLSSEVIDNLRKE